MDRNPLPLDSSSRFQSRIRHYHQLNREGEVTWDDWVGDKKKSAFRRKFDSIFMNIAIIFVGLGLLGGAFMATTFVMKKVISLIAK